MIKASIVICTYRRPQELAHALDGVQQQTAEPSRFEVIVVDNDPENSAMDLVQSRSLTLRNLRYVQEPALGIAFARTRGLNSAEGEWVVYLDDDCVPDKSWLAELFSHMDTPAPPGVITGPVLPAWPYTPPKWLTPDFYSALSVCDYAGPAGGFWLDFPRQQPLSANSAYPRELLLRLGGFNTRYGRQGTSLRSGEETELNFRLQAMGLGMWYCPRAVVHHHFPPVRLTRAFFRSRMYWAGIDEAHLSFDLQGRSQLRKRMARRLILDPVRFLGYGLVLRRNPFLTEIYFRELFSYTAEAVRLLRQSVAD